MNLRELYTEAIAEKFHSLCLLIEFLVFEKQVLSFESDARELDLYFKPNNRRRMNYLLLEYRQKVG
ncbi:hypothetical protein [Oceanobacillus indicireducens]|uniref:Uncharacterized protein n=1 Tax=Oceanobacillus indicireducens TaxID=1004261 RepID=A0A917XV19_9BACI|nr:hypothetical protein [Oceanobacillus indicireducens]GGN54966.1 hypothetical protein GCM10007971_13300 [Oceanobacillus indicireducens]